MNKILQEIFEQYKVNFDKLKQYGFTLDSNQYKYSTLIVNNQMRLTIFVNLNGEVETEVFDLECEEVYTIFLAEGATGVFIGEVKKEYEKTLIDIRNNCFDKTVFKSNYTTMLANYIKGKYGDELEFLWEKSPNNAVCRRKDNKKWYCAFLKTKAKSIGLNGDYFVEVIDFMENPEIMPNIIDNVNYFPAYHMNKKYWLTIRLDGCTLDIKKIFEHIDTSYSLANKKPVKNRD